MGSGAGAASKSPTRTRSGTGPPGGSESAADRFATPIHHPVVGIGTIMAQVNHSQYTPSRSTNPRPGDSTVRQHTTSERKAHTSAIVRSEQCPVRARSMSPLEAGRDTAHPLAHPPERSIPAALGNLLNSHLVRPPGPHGPLRAAAAPDPPSGAVSYLWRLPAPGAETEHDQQGHAPRDQHGTHRPERASVHAHPLRERRRLHGTATAAVVIHRVHHPPRMVYRNHGGELSHGDGHWHPPGSRVHPRGVV